MCSLKNSQNLSIQSLPLDTSLLFSTFLNYNVVGIEKHDGICLPTFAVDKFKEFLNLSINPSFFIHTLFLQNYLINFLCIFFIYENV